MDTIARRVRTIVAIPLVLAAVVAGGSTGLTGLQLGPATEAPADGPERPFQDVLGERVDPGPVASPPVQSAAAAAGGSAVAPLEARSSVSAIWVARVASASTAALEAPPETTAPTPSQEARDAEPVVAPSWLSRYQGRSRFWMPALDMNRKVYDFPCPRERPPDHYLYRWWCAGKNNVYIMGHAASVMKPLHDAFVRGRLRVGMPAYYANADGWVRKYRITEWRVVRPDQPSWAIASQPVPSMTLQTCVGKNDEFRLIVRLVAVD